MKKRFITIEKSESPITKIQQFLDDPLKHNIKLRAFSRKQAAGSKATNVAAWINGTLVVKDLCTSVAHYYMLCNLEQCAKTRRIEVTRVDNKVTNHKIDLAGLMAALR